MSWAYIRTIPFAQRRNPKAETVKFVPKKEAWNWGGLYPTKVNINVYNIIFITMLLATSSIFGYRNKDLRFAKSSVFLFRSHLISRKGRGGRSSYILFKFNVGVEEIIMVSIVNKIIPSTHRDLNILNQNNRLFITNSMYIIKLP